MRDSTPTPRSNSAPTPSAPSSPRTLDSSSLVFYRRHGQGPLSSPGTLPFKTHGPASLSLSLGTRALKQQYSQGMARLSGLRDGRTLSPLSFWTRF